MLAYGYVIGQFLKINERCWRDWRYFILSSEENGQGQKYVMSRHESVYKWIKS